MAETGTITVDIREQLNSLETEQREGIRTMSEKKIITNRLLKEYASLLQQKASDLLLNEFDKVMESHTYSLDPVDFCTALGSMDYIKEYHEFMNSL